MYMKNPAKNAMITAGNPDPKNNHRENSRFLSFKYFCALSMILGISSN